MLGIFISYRRQDTKGYAGRLADDLEDVFGKETVFRDIDTLAPGTNFKAGIERAIAASGVVLVLIGREWASVVDSNGNRRLDDDADPLRQEIRTAIANSSVKVIPVLLEDAKVPPAEELPPDIRNLVDLQAISVTDQRWRTDVKRLVEVIDRIPGMTSLIARAATLKGGLSSTATSFLVAGSIVVASMLLGSALMVGVSKGPFLFGFPIISVVLGMVGLVGGVLLLYASLVVILGIPGTWGKHVTAVATLGLSIVVPAIYRAIRARRRSVSGK